MKAYQIKVNGENFSLPFTHHEECLKLLSKVNFEDVKTVLVEVVEIGVGEYYRSGNVVYMKDDVYKGVVKGCYYNDHAEHIC